MDINLLVLSVGNSRIAITTFVAGEIGQVTRVPLTDRNGWQPAIAAAWERLKDTAEPAAVGASVVPAVIEPLEHMVEQVTGLVTQWVGDDVDLPVPVRTGEPAQTGVDRVLAVAAAHEQLGKACVVVDAGTAITVNCCGDDGSFLGGAIMPGVSTMLDGLHDRAARLPRVQLTAPPAEAFGTDTEKAIQQGVFYAARGMVREVVENFATHLGTWPELIATGGDAAVLFDSWELVHALSPDLVLYGIALAYTEHQIKHSS